MRHRIPLFFSLLALFLLCFTPFAYADISDSVTNDLSQDGNLVKINATWNGIPTEGTTTIPLHENGSITWQISHNPTNAELSDYISTLSNATYTIQLYKGVLGDSQLMHSETISNGTASSSGQFDFAFPGAGQYFLTYTATYATDTYPIGAVNACHGDICLLPHYLLDDFQRFVTEGMDEGSQYFGWPIPALFALDVFTIPAPPGPHISNVLFLPGSMESRLYTRDAFGNEQLLWEPHLNNDIDKLGMTESGTSNNEVYTRDVVDYLYAHTPILANIVQKLGGDTTIMYGPFEKFMDSLVTNGTLKEWRAFPYDWRQGADDIVTNGTLVASEQGTISTIRLQDTIEDLASSSPTGKVTIIAHSNGGLVAKALAVDLERTRKIQLLDKIILVGTPQDGTPFVIGNMLHGDGQTRALGLITSGSDMRTQSLTMPGIYELLPSAEYFNIIASPVATFAEDTLLTPYITTYGAAIRSIEGFVNFLSDTAQSRTGYLKSDLRTPAILLPSLLAKAAALHARIDKWSPELSLSLVSISEIGQTTVSGYAYSTREESSDCSIITKLAFQCKKEMKLAHVPLVTSEGDNTVVFISASANPDTQLFFDAAQFLQSSGENITHQSLLSAEPIQTQIEHLLLGSPALAAYMSTDTPPTRLIPDDTVISTHSPMNLLVTDTQGRETGIVAIPNTDFSITKENIPGSSVQTIDDEHYIYVPRQNSYSVSLQGTGIGLTTVEIARTSADGSLNTLQTVNDLPTMASTTGVFSIHSGIAESIAIDVDGDGAVDTTIPVISAISSSPPPVDAPKPPGHVNGQKLPAPRTKDLSYQEIVMRLLTLEKQLLTLLQHLASFTPQLLPTSKAKSHSTRA